MPQMGQGAGSMFGWPQMAQNAQEWQKIQAFMSQPAWHIVPFLNPNQFPGPLRAIATRIIRLGQEFPNLPLRDIVDTLAMVHADEDRAREILRARAPSRT